MANEEYLALLRQGVATWNRWREEHPTIHPFDLRGANLSGVNLSGANLNQANLSLANLSEANLTGTRLDVAHLRNAYLNKADLRGAQLQGTDIEGSYLRQADFRGARFGVTNFKGADLSEAKFGETDLRGCVFTEASLNEAKLSGADLRGVPLNRTDLRNADLSSVDLREANIAGAKLRQVNFNKAKLSQAILTTMDLRGANLSEADLSGADLSEADLSGANLTGAQLCRVTLVETNLTGATLTHCSIYGISVWNVQLGGAKQDGLIITSPGEPTVVVDDLEVAQFIYLLLNHQKLRNVLNAVTERGVLLLGRFGGGGLEVLQAVATRLREEKYLPIIFDFDRPRDRNYTETVKTLVGLSRFIIADLSGPSVPQELYATVPHFKIPFVPILEAGRKPFSMAVDLLEYPWVVRPPVIFASTDELVNLIPSRIIAPAEEKHQARQRLLDELFHDGQGMLPSA